MKTVLHVAALLISGGVFIWFTMAIAGYVAN